MRHTSEFPDLVNLLRPLLGGSVVVVQGEDGEGSVVQGGQVRTPTSSLPFLRYLS